MNVKETRFIKHFFPCRIVIVFPPAFLMGGIDFRKKKKSCLREMSNFPLLREARDANNLGKSFSWLHE